MSQKIAKLTSSYDILTPSSNVQMYVFISKMDKSSLDDEDAFAVVDNVLDDFKFSADGSYWR